METDNTPPAAERAELMLVDKLANEMGCKIASILDMDTLPGAIVTLVRERLGCETVSLFLAEPESGEMLFTAGTGGGVLPGPRGTVSPGEGDEDAGLIVPLESCGRVVGLLDVRSALSGEDARVLRAFSGQAAVALENARAFGGLQKRVDSFLSQLSHDLRTPLAAIMAMSEMLLDGTDADPETRNEFLEIINHESRRLDGMVEKIVKFRHSLTSKNGDVD